MSPENIYTIDCISWSELPKCINEMSKVITDNVIPAQNKSNKEWEIIRIEIWEDTGRIIAFPANREFKDRTDASVVEIRCAEIQQEIEEIDYLVLPDDAIDKKVEVVVLKMAVTLKTNMPKNISYDYEIYNQDGNKIVSFQCPAP